MMSDSTFNRRFQIQHVGNGTIYCEYVQIPVYSVLKKISFPEWDLHDLFNVEKTIFTTLAHFSALSVSSSNITQPKSTKNRHNPNKSNDRKSTNGNSNRQNKELHYNHFLVLFYLYISIHIDVD